MIPGINLLNIALGAIQPQQVQWIRFAGNTENALGQLVPAYDAPVAILGSLQAMDNAKIQMLGLDMKKSYRTLFTSHPIENVKRGESPDQIIYGGRRYEVTADADWDLQDGWRRVILIDIGAA